MTMGLQVFAKRLLLVLALLCSLGVAAAGDPVPANPDVAASASKSAAGAADTVLSKRVLTDGAATALVVVSAGVLLIGCGWVLWSIVFSRADTRARQWRLSDALSEEVSFVDAAGHTVSLLVASSSRLIAMLGLIVILSLYIGVGMVVLFAFATGGAVPSIVDSVLKFLVGGAGLFVPYLANQLRAGLEKKPAVASAASRGVGPVTVPELPKVPSGPKV